MNTLAKFSLFLLSGTLAATAQTMIKKAPVEPVSPVSGSKMFATYCATCHGNDAKGNGPAANALRVPPPDLTILTKRNNGKFPEMRFTARFKEISN